jgi:hypothetical protein
MSEQEELKNQAYKDSKILYEDEIVILLKCLSYESAEYFGPKFLTQDWPSFRNDDKFIIVDKKKDFSPTSSYLITVDKSNNVSYYNPDGGEIKPSQLFHWFFDIENILMKILPPSNIYQALKKIQMGVEMTEYELNRMDDLVSGFRFNKSQPSKSMVKLKFDSDEDFFKLFDLGDGDIWFLKNLFSYYGNYDMGFYHSDMAYQDWKEGYLVYEIVGEAREKLFELVSYFIPGVEEINDETAEQISKLLTDTFPRQTENIIDDYQSEKEQCMSRTAKESVNNELKDPFMNYGVIEKYMFSTYVTTVNVLLGLFKTFDMKDSTLYELFRKMGHEKSVGPFEEYMYEYGCNDFDSESFNSTALREIKEMIEDVESSDRFSNLDEFKNVTYNIRKRFEFKKWYKTPKDKNVSFSIINVDPKTNKINIIAGKQYEGQKKRSLTLDEFNSFLYNLELFERKIWKSKKKL